MSINDSDFEQVNVADLLRSGKEKLRFSVPSYQRGYRWEEKQITDLLNDIYDFIRQENNKGSTYYLQPLVVRREIDGSYEVLDGQQRLTTMFLILSYLCQDSPEDKDRLYELSYKTRNSALRVGEQDIAENNHRYENLDSFYIARANFIIKRWFEKGGQKRQIKNSFSDHLLEVNQITGKNIQFIWYCVNDNPERPTDELENIQVFNRLNKGKISLTNSELIKALFALYMKNQTETNGIRLTPEQFALQWNNIERRFEDKAFWSFLSNDTTDDKIQTKMDLLFDFATTSEVSVKGNNAERNRSSAYLKLQNLYDFQNNQDISKLDDFWKLKSENGIKDNLTDMKEAWIELILERFNLLESWFENNDDYHYIGYLIASGEKNYNNPFKIYREIEMSKRAVEKRGSEWTRSDVLAEYRQMIRNTLKYDKRELTLEDIPELNYEEDSKLIFKLLLLFNIETCRTSKTRFNFRRFKSEHWDIEHIEAKNDSFASNYEARIDWIKHIQPYFDAIKKDFDAIEDAVKDSDVTDFDEEWPNYKDLKKEIVAGFNSFANLEAGSAKNKVAMKDFAKLYTNTLKLFAGITNSTNTGLIYDRNLAKNYTEAHESSANNLGNLTLLNDYINRGYKDAPFSVKRDKIIQYDKDGDFLLDCTKNIFLKYYSKSSLDNSFLDNIRWNEKDRQDYLEAVKDKMKDILASNNEEDENE